MIECLIFVTKLNLHNCFSRFISEIMVKHSKKYITKLIFYKCAVHTYKYICIVVHHHPHLATEFLSSSQSRNILIIFQI